MKYIEITPNGAEIKSSLSTLKQENYFLMKDIHVETHFIVERVLDGDSLIVKQEYGQISKEIRLYGF